MKKGVIKGLVLLAVFLVTMAGFTLFINREKTENTRDFGTPTLPVAYMKIGGLSANRMFGYTQEMDLATMRSSLTPLTTNRSLTLQIQPYGNKISSITYEVTSADGSELVENGKIKSLEDDGNLKSATFQLTTPILMNQEYQLCFSVNIKGADKPVCYYTRIVQRTGINADTYLEFARDFYEKCISKESASDLTAYIEPDDSVTNSSFNKVTIHSNFDQFTWGKLSPTIEKKALPVINEINEMTASISQDYVISAKDSDGNTEYYNVTEFYRMGYSQSRVKLLDFERSATQIFDPDIPVLTSTGINLGVVGRDIQYVSNQSADIVAFVVNGDLWSYNRSANKCTKIFSFRNTEEIDERTEHGEHDIKIVRVSESGDVSFVVYGYMNSDEQEGKVGSAVYHYTAERNVVQELLFIQSKSSYQALKQNLSVLSYISTQDQLYLYIEENLYQVDLKSATYKLIKDNISPDCFVISSSQASVAWMEEMEENKSSHITAMSLETGEILQAAAAEGQKIKTLGFINEDLVYGVANDEDIRSDVAGNVTFAMNKLTIQKFSGETIKEYQQDGYYVTKVNIQEGLLELERATKEGDNFLPAPTDHIMNNLMVSGETVSIKSVVSERKGTQIALTFTKSGKTKNLLVLDTKFVQQETVTSLTLEVPRQTKELYYVYAKGKLQGIRTKISEAIQEADSNMGVVLNRKQQYVWERGNLPDSYKIDMTAISEGMLSAPLDETTIQSAVGDSYLVMNLTGCTLSSVRYQVAKGYPVAVKTGDGTSVLMVGYDKYNTWLYNVAEQKVYAMGMNDSTALFESAGNIFMSYREK